jgi:hypothetical protein
MVAGIFGGVAFMTMQMTREAQERARREQRPSEPTGNNVVWYRGWEVGFDQMAHDYAKSGWRAYKGGVDMDAPIVDASTYEGCLDEVDEAEDD